ncbi:hypothetical protein BD779DRAFT_861987 [Infundibulicybe gibba]|nr:hypothetical protein BD779DRAFT_861987 [Infundibulicybe gibba]
MAGTKRKSEETAATSPTRASKAAKVTSPASVKSKKPAKKSAKAPVPASTFKSQALPLHVNITHTPPSIPDDDTVPAAPEDPGFVGNLTLVPASFNTGSYGWKGSRRITVELENKTDGGEKETVQVMLTINATVVGSKQAKSDEDETAAAPEEESPEKSDQENAE